MSEHRFTRFQGQSGAAMLAAVAGESDRTLAHIIDSDAAPLILSAISIGMELAIAHPEYVIAYRAQHPAGIVANLRILADGIVEKAPYQEVPQ